MSRKKLKKSTETATEATAPTTNTSAIVPSRDGLVFTCQRKELLATVKTLASIAPKKCTMPMLSNVLIRADLDGVIVAATDLDVYGIVEAPTWHVRGIGGFTVNAKALADVLGKMPDGTVTLTHKDRHLEIVQGAASVLLEGMPARDFPKLPPVLPSDKAVPYTCVDAAAFQDALSLVSHAVCKDETRFHLAGILIEYGTDRILRTVATDGHRLVRAQRALAREGDFTTAEIKSGGIILPERAAKEVRKLCGAMRKRQSKCKLAFVAAPHGTTPTMLAVRDGGSISTTLVCKLTDAQYPPYEQVIPKENTRLVTVDRKAILGALSRAKLVASATKGVRLEVLGNEITLACDSDAGETRETFAAEGLAYADKLVVGLQPRYLGELLDQIEGARVTIALSANDKPVKYTDKTNLKTYQLEPILVRETVDVTSVALAQSALVGVIMPMSI